MNLGDEADFDSKFSEAYGSLKCAELLKGHGRRCNEFVVAFYRNLRETWQKEGINRENAMGSAATHGLPKDYPSTTPRLPQVLFKIKERGF